jgi:hypothetical protein
LACLALLAASLIASSSAIAQATNAINWSGAGWYADQESFIATALYAGPFPNQQACEAAKAQLLARGYPTVACDYQEHNPDEDNNMIINGTP